MLTIRYASTFKKDFKRIKRRGYDLSLLAKTVELLSYGEGLPPGYKEHVLIGDYAGCLECHITPDWLLVYRIIDRELVLYRMRTGTHSDIFS